MKRVLVSIIVLCLFYSLTLAQNFGREAGVRGGITSGITYRQYLENNFSYEGLLSIRKDGMQFTLLRQIHEQTLFEYSDNLYFVYGYGAHAGFFYDYQYRVFLYSQLTYQERRFSPVAGIDGYAALEYRFPNFPVSIALDYKPFFELSAYQFFKISIWDMAFAVKYRF
ncbi:MAG: hypothetical protein H6538_02435 [Bacteroidales bacterium]|nr:hypothetical protein [Bacteroidales bacterium]MCB8999280.1 hypothetical protein [Bacteroidales bacterium]MCB9013050.1 hypothetical protein [Bacteroidales bacterium]